jgi:hypothetical protein
MTFYTEAAAAFSEALTGNVTELDRVCSTMEAADLAELDTAAKLLREAAERAYERARLGS